MNAPRVIAALSAPVLAIALAGCGDSSSDDAGSGGDGGGDGKKLQVVTSFYPLEYAIQQIGGDKVEVTNLTEAGVDPHDLELSPKAVGTVGSADMVIYLSGFQNSVDEAVKSEAKDSSFDVKETADLSLVYEEAVDLEGHDGGDSEDGHDHDHGDEDHDHDHDHGDEGHDHDHGDEGHDHDHDHDHGDEGHDHDHGDGATDEATEGAEDGSSEDGHDHDHEGHDHGHEGHDHNHAEAGEADPHFWLDPVRYGDVADAIAEQLAEKDPDNADTYKKNAEKFGGSLDTLDSDFESGLKDCKSRDLVTTHQAFGYLADRYDFKQVGITGLSPSTEPSPTRMKAVTEFVKKNNVSTIYTEVIAQPKVGQTIADETGAEMGVLDPLEGITDQSQGQDYMEVMEANLESLKKGQDCS